MAVPFNECSAARRSYIYASKRKAFGYCRSPLVAQAKEIESSPEIDAVFLTEGSALIIQVRSVRLELDQDLKKLKRAVDMIASDPEIMRGTPVYRGTRIPVELIADMLSQGANPEEILEGYPALDRDKVELAPLYVQAFPRRGRPAS
jgi:uncharacterized protein (DUF433 family)